MRKDVYLNTIAMEDVKEILRLIDNSDNSKQELYDLVLGEDEKIGYHAAWVLTHFSTEANKWLYEKQDELNRAKCYLKKQVLYTLTLLQSVPMLIGSVVLSQHPEEISYPLWFVLLFCCIFLYTINIPRMTSKKKTLIDIYSFIKVNVLILLVLNALNVDIIGYVFSIVFIFSSLFFVYLGFSFRVSVFRISGLLFASLMLIKLLIADITLTNSLYKAISYLFCGLICLFISYIYHIFSAGYKNKEDS